MGSESRSSSRQIVAAHGGIIWAEHPPHQGVAAGTSWWDRTATNEIRSAVVDRDSTPGRERKISLTAREKEILTIMPLY